MTCTIEWRIENFSCWVEDVHGSHLSCPKTTTFPDFRVWLLPLGEGGRAGSNMRVSCHLGKLGRRGGELNFFGSDRVNKIRTETIPSTKDENARLALPGPNLMAVIGQIRLEEPTLGDSMTLLFSFPHDNPSTLSLCTTLQVLSDVTVRWECARLLEDPEKAPQVLLTCVRQRNDEEERANVEASFDKSRIMHLRLRPETPWAMSGLSVLSHVGTLDLGAAPVRAVERRQHTFYKMDPHGKESFLLAQGFREADLAEPGRIVLVRLQFVSGEKKHSKEGGGWTMESPDAGRSSPAPPLIERAVTTAVLKEELGALYRDREFTDFRLRCAGKVFDVHRAILAARSPVFRKRLRSNKSTMDVADMDPDTLEQFLFFVYSGALGAPSLDGVLKLYEAADRFQVESLREECVDCLARDVSVSSVCRVLSLADKHDDQRLLNAAMRFIQGNFKKVSTSDEWASHAKSDPQLIIKTVTYFASNGFLSNDD